MGVEVAKDFDQACGHACPSGLVARSEAGTVVAMKVLVEQLIAPPMRIALELRGSPVHRTSAGFVAQKNSGQPTGDFPGNLEQIHQVARAGRALNPEAVTVIVEVVHEGANDQCVNRQPDVFSLAVVAQSGRRPTTERTFSRVALPSGKRSTS